MNALAQSGFYKLTRRLFLQALPRNLTLCGALFVLTLLLLRGSVDENTFAYAYESLLRQSGVRYAFVAALAASAILSAVQCYFDLFKNGGVYALMMLPMPRRHIFLAHCAQGVAAILMLWACQILALLAAYPLVQGACRAMAENYAKSYGSAPPFAPERTNGLFLAFVRSDLFRILLPQSLAEGLHSLFAVLALGCTPAYVLLCGSSVKVAFPVLLPIAEVAALMQRFDAGFMGLDAWAFYRGLLFLTIASAGLAIDGIRRLNKDAGLA